VSRGWALVGGLVVTWTIAVVVAIVLSVAAAWPLALFLGGNPVAARSVAFVLAMLATGWWALRTSVSLWHAHAGAHDVFRRGWPTPARGAELRGLGLLDRRGQPGGAQLDAGDIVAELQGGERSGRAFVLDRAARVYLLVDGPRDAVCRLEDVEAADAMRAEPDGRPRITTLAAGTYRLVIERTTQEDRTRASGHGWWIAADPEGPS
jgi:hypothetical protein